MWDLPRLGIEPMYPAWQTDSLPAEPPGKPQTGTDSQIQTTNHWRGWGRREGQSRGIRLRDTNYYA